MAAKITINREARRMITAFGKQALKDFGAARRSGVVDEDVTDVTLMRAVMQITAKKWESRDAKALLKNLEHFI